MSKKRFIKKYPNRRLYDTEASKYITLEDVRRLVLDSNDFIVKDVKTEEDLTRNILLQIIIEQEKEHLFNSTLCKGPDGYVLAYESNTPDYPDTGRHESRRESFGKICVSFLWSCLF